ncbi:MAG: hypothetical protein U9R57_16670 [Thermodesulfobacteriota bacterium]|nr:hypothetical protein [Thermodesulfobacteriota bacterium]
MKKGLLIGCVSVVAVAMMSSSALAAVYETLTVKRATVKPNGLTTLMLETTSNSGSFTWYTVPQGSDDQSLAIALTAISLGNKVRVGKPSAGSTVILEIGLDNANL